MRDGPLACAALSGGFARGYIALGAGGKNLNLIEMKVTSEWRGLRLGEIGRPTTAVPPQKSYIRGTIEDMLGASLEG